MPCVSFEASTSSVVAGLLSALGSACGSSCANVRRATSSLNLYCSSCGSSAMNGSIAANSNASRLFFDRPGRISKDCGASVSWKGVRGAGELWNTASANWEDRACGGCGRKGANRHRVRKFRPGSCPGSSPVTRPLGRWPGQSMQARLSRVDSEGLCRWTRLRTLRLDSSVRGTC